MYLYSSRPTKTPCQNFSPTPLATTSHMCHTTPIVINGLEDTMDKNRVYWVWQDGKQVMIYFDTYVGDWCAMVNNSGRAV